MLCSTMEKPACTPAIAYMLKNLSGLYPIAALVRLSMNSPPMPPWVMYASVLVCLMRSLITLKRHPAKGVTQFPKERRPDGDIFSFRLPNMPLSIIPPKPPATEKNILEPSPSLNAYNDTGSYPRMLYDVPIFPVSMTDLRVSTEPVRTPRCIAHNACGATNMLQFFFRLNFAFISACNTGWNTL